MSVLMSLGRQEAKREVENTIEAWRKEGFLSED
jgi:hypothetical protein